MVGSHRCFPGPLTRLLELASGAVPSPWVSSELLSLVSTPLCHLEVTALGNRNLVCLRRAILPVAQIEPGMQVRGECVSRG